MSVIAKLQIRSVNEFGSGRLVELSCVCANDLMTAYAESEEDKLFTKYSPWGEMKLQQPSNFCLGEVGDAFYVMLLRTAEAGDPQEFRGAYAVGRARCVSLTDFGDNQAKRVEICDSYADQRHRGFLGFNWKMSVDNPPATDQFKPGEDDYYIAFYPAKSFSRDEAIQASLGT